MIEMRARVCAPEKCGCEDDGEAGVDRDSEDVACG